MISCDREALWYHIVHGACSSPASDRLKNSN
jgi:hypothetical protein